MTRPYNTRAGASVMKALRTNSTSPKIAAAAGVSARVARKILLNLSAVGLAKRDYLSKVEGYKYTPRQAENKH